MISVIIPLYNKESIIERSLQSVLSQNFDDFEVVVVNDGSTDKSAEIVREIKDSRITLIEQENGGPSKARNTGVKHAKGEWILFLDADDELLPGALNHFRELVIIHADADVFVGEIKQNDGQTIVDRIYYRDGYVFDVFKTFAHGLMYPCSGSSLYKKSICDQHLYNEELWRFEDLDCLFRKYRSSNLYLTHFPVACVNVEYASASRARKSIKEDFLGHVDMRGKCFWERMCLYKLFVEERTLYPEETRQLYPDLHRRYDMFFLYKLVGWMKKYPFIWNLYLRVIGLSQFAK